MWWMAHTPLIVRKLKLDAASWGGLAIGQNPARTKAWNLAVQVPARRQPPAIPPAEPQSFIFAYKLLLAENSCVGCTEEPVIALHSKHSVSSHFSVSKVLRAKMQKGFEFSALKINPFLPVWKYFTALRWDKFSKTSHFRPEGKNSVVLKFSPNFGVQLYVDFQLRDTGRKSRMCLGFLSHQKCLKLAEKLSFHQSKARPCIPDETSINELWTSNSRTAPPPNTNHWAKFTAEEKPTMTLLIRVIPRLWDGE